jgi:hypothetical protein
VPARQEQSRGIVLFLLSLLIWWAVYGADNKAELLFWAVLASPAGAVSFYLLALKTTPQVDPLSVNE